MKISAIVAIDESCGIGRENQIPWHLREDLQRFTRMPMHKPVIMGRKTHESIGFLLPGRLNIVLSRSTDCIVQEGAILVHHPTDALAKAQDFFAQSSEETTHQECMIIGGSTIYETFQEETQRLYLTVVQGSYDCDTFFPSLHTEAWSIEERTIVPSPDKDVPAHLFLVLEKHSSWKTSGFDSTTGTRMKKSFQDWCKQGEAAVSQPFPTVP